MEKQIALIAGASGIVGLNLATHLAAKTDWVIYGLARRPGEIDGVLPLAADLLDPATLRAALGSVAPTHVFFCTWTRRPTEAENCEVNGRMLTNLLDAAESPTLRHVTLVTGNKHYLGSFENYASGSASATPFREEQPRVPGLNFYYTQEDILFARAAAGGYAWNVHRPPTIIGYALGNAMNMGVTLATYASLCHELGRPFLFPGSPQQYRGITDIVDATQLAHQLHWAATTEAAWNNAFNITNGDVFRWQWLWAELARYFNVEVGAYPGHPTPLEEQMANDAPAWDALVQKHGLRPYRLDQLASGWHTDADLSRPMETINDMSRSRRLGFHHYVETRASFFALFDRLRRERVIPSSSSKRIPAV